MIPKIEEHLVTSAIPKVTYNFRPSMYKCWVSYHQKSFTSRFQDVSEDIIGCFLSIFNGLDSLLNAFSSNFPHSFCCFLVPFGIKWVEELLYKRGQCSKQKLRYVAVPTYFQTAPNYGHYLYFRIKLKHLILYHTAKGSSHF